MTVSPSKDEEKTDYNAKETELRRESALKRMLATPPKPHAEQDKKKASPAKVKTKKS